MSTEGVLSPHGFLSVGSTEIPSVSRLKKPLVACDVRLAWRRAGPLEAMKENGRRLNAGATTSSVLAHARIYATARYWVFWDGYIGITVVHG